MKRRYFKQLNKESSVSHWIYKNRKLYVVYYGGYECRSNYTGLRELFAKNNGESPLEVTEYELKIIQTTNLFETENYE